MRGDFVLVRGFGGRVVRMREWEDAGDYIAVLAPDSYEGFLAGEDAVVPIAYPKSDVKKDSGADDSCAFAT